MMLGTVRMVVGVALALVLGACDLGGRKAASPPHALEPTRSASPAASVPAKPKASVEESLADLAEHASDTRIRTDASFRLAVLVSDRERAAGGTDLAARLARPISILRRLVRDDPACPYLFLVEYQLASDLADAGRLAESSQVFRSLVCRNHDAYPVPNDPNAPERDSLVPLPQERPEAFWRAWETQHQTPILHPAVDPAREERFLDPYAGCTALPVDKNAGSLASEIWLRIGHFDFDMVSPEEGPYALNRAASAFSQAIAFASAPGSGATEALLAQARYMLAWTYYKQQRYSAAVATFGALLDMNAGSDFDKEAETYLAASLTELDFVGPAVDEPYIPRPEVLDTESDPREAEAKMSIGISRVGTPATVPQDRRWTPSVYLALAREYVQLSQFGNAAQVYDQYLAKWPVDDAALQARFELGTTWMTASRIHKTDKDAVKKARAQFAEVEKQGSPSGAWLGAHQADRKAIDAAAVLVKAARAQLDAPH